MRRNRLPPSLCGLPKTLCVIFVRYSIEETSLTLSSSYMTTESHHALHSWPRYL